MKITPPSRIQPVTGFLLILLSFVVMGSSNASVVDRVLASVDREVILLSDIMMEIAPFLPEIERSTASLAERDAELDTLIRSTLDQAIDNRILLREALLRGLQVNDDMVERQLRELRNLYPSPEAFLSELERSGENMNDLRARLRKQLLARHVAADKMREFGLSVSVSESEVAQYFEDNKERFTQPERVRIRQIFLMAPESGSEREVIRQRLEALRDELEMGASFQELSANHSQAPGASDGGIIGWIARGDLVPALEEAAFALPKDEVSDVIETQMGFHLLRVDDRREAGTGTLRDMRTEIEPMIREEKAKAMFDKWMEDLRKRSQVQVFL